MAFDFPNTPSVGQTFNNWVWDGEKWVTTANPTASGAVRYDLAQGLALPQRQQGRQNIEAAPFDVNKGGLIINGTFEINSWAWGTSTGTSQIIDCWIFNKSPPGAMTCSMYGSGPPGFVNSLQITVQTPLASVGAGDSVDIYQNVEGTLMRRLAWGYPQATPLTIIFWTCHNRPGQYGGSFNVYNGTGHRSCTFGYTQNVANTWEYKTVTIPANLVDVIPFDQNSCGVLRFTMVSGAAAPPLVWGALNAAASTVPGAVNGAAATSDVFKITGINAFPGVEAPSQDRSPLAFLNFSEEIIRSSRYIRKFDRILVQGSAPYSTNIVNAFLLSPQMRIAPSVSLLSPILGNATGYGVDMVKTNMFRVYVTNNAATYGYLECDVYLDARM